MARTGLKLTDVLFRAWDFPFSVQSNFARENASLVAMAASDGFISTKVATGVYGHRWRITLKGMEHLRRLHGDRDDVVSE